MNYVPKSCRIKELLVPGRVFCNRYWKRSFAEMLGLDRTSKYFISGLISFIFLVIQMHSIFLIQVGEPVSRLLVNTKRALLHHEILLKYSLFHRSKLDESWYSF